MKKVMNTIGAILLASIFMTSCGSSLEGDATKIAELLCKSQQLSIKANNGDTSSISEAQEMMLEVEELKKDFGNKYENGTAKKDFENAVIKAMSKMNCK